MGSNASITSVAIKTPPNNLASGGRQQAKPTVVAAPASQSNEALDAETSPSFKLLLVANTRPTSATAATLQETNGKAGLQRVSMHKRSEVGETQCSQLTCRGE